MQHLGRVPHRSLLLCCVTALLGCASEHLLGDLSEKDLAAGSTASPSLATDGIIAPRLAYPDVTLAEQTVWLESHVVGVGDVDGDGYGDLASRNMLDDTLQYVHLRYGGPRPRDAVEQLRFAQSGVLLTHDRIVGDGAPRPWIETIAGLGDVDGDGYSDFLVGLGRCNPSREGEGVYLLYGGPQRLTGVEELKTAAVFLASPHPQGAAPLLGGCGAVAGAFAAGLGDLDGDGLDDFIVGEPRHVPLDNWPEPSPARPGVAYLFYGSAERLENGTPLSEADARLHAEHDVKVTALGDTNADGRSDLILGDDALGQSEIWWYETPPGEFYWLPGSAERLAGDIELAAIGVPARRAMPAGDLDGDRVQDLILFDSAAQPYLFYGEPELFAEGVELDQAAATFDTAGLPLALAPVGDLDGDGDDELALGQLLETWHGGPREITLLSGTRDRSHGSVGPRQGGERFEDLYWMLEGVFAAGDLDGDGVGDLVTRSGEYYEAPVEVLEQGDPTPERDLVRREANAAWLHIHYGKRASAATTPR